MLISISLMSTEILLERTMFFALVQCFLRCRFSTIILFKASTVESHIWSTFQKQSSLANISFTGKRIPQTIYQRQGMTNYDITYDYRIEGIFKHIRVSIIENRGIKITTILSSNYILFTILYGRDYLLIYHFHSSFLNEIIILLIHSKT